MHSAQTNLSQRSCRKALELRCVESLPGNGKRTCHHRGNHPFKSANGLCVPLAVLRTSSSQTIVGHHSYRLRPAAKPTPKFCSLPVRNDIPGVIVYYLN